MKRSGNRLAGLVLTVITLMFTGCGSDSSPPAVLSISTASLPGATSGTAYSQTLAATGGTTPYTWTLATGSAALPAWLTLSTTGTLSGTPPTGAANANFTVMVTDSATPAGTATKALSITVTAPGALVTVTTTSLPGATIGTAYSQPLAASGGTTPYTWTLATGSAALPAWLTLSTTGTLSGTPPTGAVTANFTVMVTDSSTPARTATMPLSIVVTAAGTAVPAAPTGVVATGGTNSVSVTWPAVTGATSYNIYWSAVTGVTTTSGTKITGATSPTLHSRLTATPTWLAANTSYFYIVTAVNSSGESAASTQATATTSATDGVALYVTNCAGCHPQLSNPAGKHGRSASTIQAAINGNTGGMATTSLLSLTPAQVQAIADVLVTGF